MNEQLFNIVLLFIPVIGTVITGFIIPLLKAKLNTERAKLGAEQTGNIITWVEKTVETAEKLFNVPQSGAEKREYVINFINGMFNSRKEVITEKQIRVLLEACLEEMEKTKKGGGGNVGQVG